MNQDAPRPVPAPSTQMDAEDTLAEFIEAHAERRRYVEAHDPNVLVNINTPDLYRTHLGEDPTTLSPES